MFGSGQITRPGPNTGTYWDHRGYYHDTCVTWYGTSGGTSKKKKVWTFEGFLTARLKLVMDWRTCFEEELTRMQRYELISRSTATFYLWTRPVEYIIRSWLSVDWRWVFKRWVQELYAEA